MYTSVNSRKLAKIMQEIDSSQSWFENENELCRLIPKLTGDRLQQIAYESLAGDMLGGLQRRGKHAGNPARRDASGFTKKDTYKAALGNDVKYFQVMAAKINSGKWDKLFLSQRVALRRNNKKERMIDLPPEAKRLYGHFVLDALKERSKSHDLIGPTIIGFRSVNEFPQFSGRKSFTIQDVFAATVFTTIRKQGPWVVYLDLQDAFGNLPHRAIREALSKLNIPRNELRKVIELVRIRSRLADGRTYKPRGRGIEQGNPASPFVFNAVMGLFANEMRKEGIEMVCYGDDIILVVKSESQAQSAYGMFEQLAQKYGFENLRGLGNSGKCSRIVNTEIDCIDVLKTYRINAAEIRLCPQKLKALAAAKPKSIRQARKSSTYKTISKTQLKKIVNLPSGATAPPGCNQQVEATKSNDDAIPFPTATTGESEEYQKDTWLMGYINRNCLKFLLCPSRKDAYTYKPCLSILNSIISFAVRVKFSIASIIGLGLTIGASDNRSRDISFSGLTKSAIPGAVTQKQELLTESGRMSAARMKGGFEACVIAGPKNAGKVGCHLPASHPVKVRAGDLRELALGRRLRVGEFYRGRTLDLRGLDRLVPALRLPHAITQLVRVSSDRGRSRLLTHPGEVWTVDEHNFSRLSVLRRLFHPKGQILVVRRAKTDRTSPKKSVRTPRPDVNLAVTSVRRPSQDWRKWKVRLESGGKVWHRVYQLDCTNPAIAQFEATALAVMDCADSRGVNAIGIPTTSLAATCLIEPSHLTHAGLSDAAQKLKSWKWARKGSWLVGTKTRQTAVAKRV